MFYNYNAVTYLSKAHNDELLCEAYKARQAEATKQNRPADSKQKKAFPFAFGPAAASNR